MLPVWHDNFVKETAVPLIPFAFLLQWIDGVLSRGGVTHFFYDEFRCPVYVKDLVNIILALTEIWISGMYFWNTIQ